MGPILITVPRGFNCTTRGPQRGLTQLTGCAADCSTEPGRREPNREPTVADIRPCRATASRHPCSSTPYQATCGIRTLLGDDDARVQQLGEDMPACAITTLDDLEVTDIAVVRHLM